MSSINVPVPLAYCYRIGTVLFVVVLLGIVPTLMAKAELLANSFATYPAEAQVAWQEREVELFLHFGINTFVGVEWGSGKTSPRHFNPTNLDCRQWVAVARSGGARGAVLTAKHHDGFCLWSTDTTDYSVRASPWQAGKGDVVREFVDACREAGLAPGLYLSPADLHEPSYGRDHAAYNEFFRRQLRELLTRYGEVSEIWFDGATPGNLRQQHDWQSYYRLIRELQPQTVIVTRGPDVRWVGNEAGIARESEWSVIPLPRPAAEYDWPDMIGDLGSRARWKETSQAHWYPAVATVSLRPGWFWTPNEDHRIRDLGELLRIHDQTVGRNAGLLLNVPPDRTGQIAAADARRIAAFGESLHRRYSTNLAVVATWQVTATPEDGTNQWTGVMTFPQPVKFNAVVLREDIRQGQHVESWQLWPWPDDPTVPAPKPWGTGTTIGYKRLSRGAAVTTRELRLRITESRTDPKLLPPEVHWFPR